MTQGTKFADISFFMKSTHNTTVRVWGEIKSYGYCSPEANLAECKSRLTTACLSFFKKALMKPKEDYFIFISFMEFQKWAGLFGTEPGTKCTKNKEKLKKLVDQNTNFLIIDNITELKTILNFNKLMQKTIQQNISFNPSQDFMEDV